jgi:hypothetical protein
MKRSLWVAAAALSVVCACATEAMAWDFNFGVGAGISFKCNRDGRRNRNKDCYPDCGPCFPGAGPGWGDMMPAAPGCEIAPAPAKESEKGKDKTSTAEPPLPIEHTMYRPASYGQAPMYHPAPMPAYYPMPVYAPAAQHDYGQAPAYWYGR